MSQFGFYFNNVRCIGCKTCMIACSDYYDLPLEITFRKVYDIEGGDWNYFPEDGRYEHSTYAYHLSMSCNHCAKPACVAVCPTTAMYKCSETGIVKIDKKKCIGCGACTVACPYNSPMISKKAGHAVKCEACYHRLDENKDPICVTACPLRALSFGQINSLRDKYQGSVSRIFPMPSSEITWPNVAILPSVAAKLPDVGLSSVANPEEV